jgi:hypothetical protein
VLVHEIAATAAVVTSNALAPRASLPNASDNVVIEAMRMNAAIAKIRAMLGTPKTRGVS